jgi:hypothetical protein
VHSSPHSQDVLQHEQKDVLKQRRLRAALRHSLVAAAIFGTLVRFSGVEDEVLNHGDRDQSSASSKALSSGSAPY